MHLEVPKAITTYGIPVLIMSHASYIFTTFWEYR